MNKKCFHFRPQVITLLYKYVHGYNKLTVIANRSRDVRYNRVRLYTVGHLEFVITEIDYILNNMK